MASISAEQTTDQQLKYKTWVLKVSIHCEGCKRKVKKVLHKINGVYTISIDTQKQRVTVTGNVDVEALIKRLIKTGKHAEIWPENLAGEEKRLPGKKPNKSKEKDPQSIGNGSANNDNNNQQSRKKMEAQANKAVMSVTTKSSEAEKSKENLDGQRSKEREYSPVKSHSGGDSGEAEKSGGGGGRSKKKKRKGQNGNNNDKVGGGGVGSCGGPAGTGSRLNHDHQGGNNNTNHGVNLNHSQPQRYFYPRGQCNYWPSYHYHPLVYGNNRSYTAPHRSETRHPPMFCYASSWPYTYENGHQHQEVYDHGSFEIFSDENANGCFIM